MSGGDWGGSGKARTTTTGAPSGDGAVVGIPSYAGMAGTTAVVWLATFACAGFLAWLFRLQMSREKDWEEMSLPTFVLELERTLARSKLPDTRILNWAEIADLPPEFWDEFNHIYAEFGRCSGEVKDSRFFDFWDWAKLLPKPPPAPKLTEPDEPALFNLGLLVPYATLVKIGLGQVAEWRHGEDLQYDTLAPVGQTARFLPKDTSQGPTSMVSKRTQKKGKGKGKIDVVKSKTDAGEVLTGTNREEKDASKDMDADVSDGRKKSSKAKPKAGKQKKDADKLHSVSGESWQKSAVSGKLPTGVSTHGDESGLNEDSNVVSKKVKKEKEQTTEFGTAHDEPSGRDKFAAPVPAKSAAKPAAPAKPAEKEASNKEKSESQLVSKTK